MQHLFYKPLTSETVQEVNELLGQGAQVVHMRAVPTPGNLHHAVHLLALLDLDADLPYREPEPGHDDPMGVGRPGVAGRMVSGYPGYPPVSGY